MDTGRSDSLDRGQTPCPFLTPGLALCAWPLVHSLHSLHKPTDHPLPRTHPRSRQAPGFSRSTVVLENFVFI